MGTGPVMAAYVIAQFNNIPLYGWLREGIEHWQVTSIDSATNYTAVFAIFLNGCFCFISFAAVAAILAKVGPTRPRQWLTSDVNWPYHAWLVMGVVALLLDYVAVLMFLVPRSVFAAVFLGLILPLGSVGPFVCVRIRYPLSSRIRVMAHITLHSRSRVACPSLALQI